MSESAVSLKETLELIDAVEAVSVKIAQAAKDGLQVTDLMALIDQDLWAKLSAGVAGISQVPVEIGDLDWKEVGELSGRGISMIEAIVTAVK